MEPLFHILSTLALAGATGLSAKRILRLALPLQRSSGASAPREERWARRRALRAGLACLEAQQRYPLLQGPGPSLDRVAGEYRQRLRAKGASSPAATVRAPLAQELRVRLRALSAERKELVRLRRIRRIDDSTFQSLSARLDHDEVTLCRRSPLTNP